MSTAHALPAATVRRILVMPASNRHGSLNRALARQLVDRLADGPAAARRDVSLLDLRDHPLPLYDGDLEARDGVPAAATTLAQRVMGAHSLIIVSPEYNGAFSPLLKNAVDWVTRVHTHAFAHLDVLVAAASPGGGGGANGLSLLRTWLQSMGVQVGRDTLCVPRASIAPDGGLVLDDAEVEEFLRQATSHTVAA